MKRVLKPVSGLVLFSVLFCFAGTDLALAQQVSVMAAQESEEKELPYTIGLKMIQEGATYSTIITKILLGYY